MNRIVHSLFVYMDRNCVWFWLNGKNECVILVTKTDLEYFSKQKYSKLLKEDFFHDVLFVNQQFLTIS